MHINVEGDLRDKTHSIRAEISLEDPLNAVIKEVRDSTQIA